MNYKYYLDHEAGLPYRRRNYILWELDDGYFDALNEGGHVLSLNGYSLDAIDEIPAGSMVSIGGRPAIHYGPERGVSLQEHLELLDAIDDAIKSDER